MFCARAAGHDGGQCDPAHYCAAERSADAIVDCHRSWSPRPANPRLRQHADALLQPCYTCDFHDDGRNRFAACKQIVALLVSRHNARFVHDLLRNLGSCRRTVATFTRTRRGFLSFLVGSRAEEDGCHSCFGVLAATIPLFIVGRQALNSAVVRLSCCTAGGYRAVAGRERRPSRTDSCQSPARGNNLPSALSTLACSDENGSTRASSVRIPLL